VAGVVLTTHPLLALRLKTGRAIPLLLPCVLALACYGMSFTFINIKPVCDRTFLQLADTVRFATLTAVGSHP
jgi:hypothetical protein